MLIRVIIACIVALAGAHYGITPIISTLAECQCKLVFL